MSSWSAAWSRAAAAVDRPLGAWRRSVSLRVVATTMALSLVVVAIVGLLLVNSINGGLLAAKEQSALVEATAGTSEAQSLMDAADTGPTTPSPSRLVDSVTGGLLARAGSPGRVVALLASPPERGETPERIGVAGGGPGGDISEASIPVSLREAVQRDSRQSWTYTEILYTNGATVPGLVVGAPLSVPGAGQYELYYLFPLTEEQETLQLVQRAVLVVAVLLVLMLAGIAYLVTRQVVSPVRVAARTAEKFSAGQLTERMSVRGEDDLAKLATSFNDMASNLQTQITRLEQLSRVQQRFVSDVSHELRTPLTTVRMAADVLYEARAELDPAAERSAELLQNQLDRFESLLADLLEISRFDAGAAVLDADPVDLRVLVERAVEAAAPLAERKQTEVVVTAPERVCLVEADARRIDRVLRNLVVNAIEHGEGRPVEVAVACNEEAVAVTVRDHGVGLKPGESSLVFNRFWRADPARARTTGGTGLGLSISLEDVRLHGGWLQAWGAPGDGASFRMTLPSTVGGSMTSSPLPLEPADAGGRGGGPLRPYRAPLREPETSAAVPTAANEGGAS
ncbi:MAG: HAMP domain-containing histidine kinase [Actinobacteria bacterium]|jgi:two-component system sensor histidine kinase MtrB|nr:HAMP domain-containing histidine kinase [Actinomycetota bacterium]